jgi:hypothetical protein
MKRKLLHKYYLNIILLIKNMDCKRVEAKKNKFLKITGEKEDLNQYWFSESTIEFIISQVERYGKRIAFISTPSIFFSVPSETQDLSILFDFDEKFPKKHKNAKIFDYREFDESVLKDSGFCGTFDFIVVDPPFITKEVWTKYAEFIKLIIADGGRVLASSISENENLLKDLLNLEIKNYQPSIPHLVYQYNFFSNYGDEELDKANPEIPI